MAKKLLPLVIIVVAVLATVVLVRTREPAQQSEVVEPSILVDVVAVAPQDTRITVESQGTVEPRTQTSLVAEVAGQVIEVSDAFVVGGFFREGEVLLRLDDRDYHAARSRAQAAVAAARSVLAQEQGQADVAQREWDRMTPERQSQIRARALYLRQPQLEEARASLAAAQADLQQAQADLDKTIITAPYDGLIRSKDTAIGQFINTGTTLAEIFAVDYAEVRLPIPENRIPFLDLPELGDTLPVASIDKPTTQVVLSSRIGDTMHRWSGLLTRTEGVLDSSTRVLFSVVRIKDPYNLYGENPEDLPLRIGTYVNASILGRLLRDVVVLPRHTLRTNNIVWVVDPENRLRAREVEVTLFNGDNVYISQGLEAGDRVVLTRLENPLNGTLVETNRLPYLEIE